MKKDPGRPIDGFPKSIGDRNNWGRESGTTIGDKNGIVYSSQIKAL